jgi:hypothetical protein
MVAMVATVVRWSRPRRVPVALVVLAVMRSTVLVVTVAMVVR